MVRENKIFIERRTCYYINEDITFVNMLKRSNVLRIMRMMYENN